MKTEKLIILPILSATFLLASCNPQESSSSSSSKNSSKGEEESSQHSGSSSSKNTSSSSSSSSSHSAELPDLDKDADKDFAILKSVLENTASENGFKAETSPFSSSFGGLRYKKDEDNKLSSTNWDLIVKADKITATETHVGDGEEAEDYNASLKVANVSFDKDKYGIGHLVSEKDSEAKVVDAAIKTLAKNMYANAYFAGDTPNRVYYDLDDDNGKESNSAHLLRAATPFILEALDENGYSVYKNDDPKNDATYEILTKAYVTISENQDTDEDVTTVASTDSSTEDSNEDTVDWTKWLKIIPDVIEVLNDNFADCVVSSRKSDVYTLSVKFSDKEVTKAIDDLIDKLDDDFEFTFSIPTDEEGDDGIKITITKDMLETIAGELDKAIESGSFDYEVSYNSKYLVNSALSFNLSIDESIYESLYGSEDTATENSTESSSESSSETTNPMIGLTSFSIDAKTGYSYYEKVLADSDESKLKEHLWSFANLPSKEKLAQYPEQTLPPKKKTTESN